MLSVLDLRRATWDGSRRFTAYYTDPYSNAAQRHAELNDAFIASFRVEKRLTPTHRGCINAMTLSADATLLATGSDDQDIFLYDVATWNRKQQIATQHQANIFGCTFVPGHPELLVSCGLDGRFCLQDVEVGSSSTKWKLPAGRFTVVATFLPDSSPAGAGGNVCFVTAQDKEVYLYDLREKVPLGVISVVAEPYQSFCVAVSDREPNMFVAGGSVITVADYRKMGVRGRGRVISTTEALFSVTLPFRDRLNESTSELAEKYYVGDTASRDVSDPFYFKGRIDSARGRHACSMRFNASATKLLVNVSNGNPVVYDWSSLRSQDPLIDSPVPAVTSLSQGNSKEASPDAESEKKASQPPKASSSSALANDSPAEIRSDLGRTAGESHEREEAEGEEEELEEAGDEEEEEWEDDDEAVPDEEEEAEEDEDEEASTEEESDDSSSALLLDAESISAIRRFPMTRGNPLELGKGNVRTDCTSYIGRANEITMFKEAAFFDDDRYIVTGGDCGKVFFWNEQTGKLVHSIQGDGDVVNGVLTDPRLPVVLACGIDHDVKVLSSTGDWTKRATNTAGMFPQTRRLGFGPGGESSDEWLEVDDSDEEDDEEEGEGEEEEMELEEGVDEDDDDDEEDEEAGHGPDNASGPGVESDGVEGATHTSAHP